MFSNKRLNEQNIGSSSALCTLVNYVTSIANPQLEKEKFPSFVENVNH